MIQIVHRNEIHVEKWNALLYAQHIHHPYTTIDYLDAVCKQWSALIIGDYEGVLPFCWNKKWGVIYIYQPPFLQQMLYVGMPLNQTWIDKVKQIFYAHYTFIDLKLNIPLSDTVRKNYVLSLRNNYEDIAAHFNSQTKKNLKKKDLVWIDNIEISTFMQFYKTHTVPKIPNWKKEFSLAQKKLLWQLQERQELLIAGAAKDGVPVAMTALVLGKDVLIHLMPSSSEEGRKYHGTSFIIDQLLRQYSGKNYSFDFEGSEIESIAQFNEGFGATPEYYYHLMSNKLNFPFNLFKK